MQDIQVKAGTGGMEVGRVACKVRRMKCHDLLYPGDIMHFITVSFNVIFATKKQLYNSARVQKVAKTVTVEAFRMQLKSL